MASTFTNYRKSLLLGAAAIAASVSSAALAQDAGSGDIVVTARKSNESILDVPLAVSAVSSEDIAKRGITSINDLARLTPSININNNSASRNDRSAQQLILRGFTPSAFTSPTASVFIDGVPLSSSSAISMISSPERVEVLKGPQTAYFGRNTFAGAINVVNKIPSTEFGGSIGGSLGTREFYRLHADIEGPLLGEWLRFRITGDRTNKGGSYTNRFDRSEKLGDQRTDAATLTLYAEPTSNLSLKAFGMVSEDNDGASAQALVSAYEVRDRNGNIAVANQSNCNLQGFSTTGAPMSHPFFCGRTPKIDWARQPSSNTANDLVVRNFLANPTGRLVSPKKGVQGYGLKRGYHHLHLNADWEVAEGVTLSSLTGYNREYYSMLADIDNYGSDTVPNTPANIAAGGRPYFDYPFYVERNYKDFSQEFRGRYETDNFHGTLGLSYLNAWQQGGLGGGASAMGTVHLSVPSGATRNRTFGAFFGLTYDFTESLSISAEGRYQIDKLYAYAAPGGFNARTNAVLPQGFYPEGTTLLQKTYKNFLPRVIVQYDFAPDLMAYASFSKGVNPGVFNTQYLSFTPEQIEAATNVGIRIAVAPEKVTNYEVGVKGKLFDRLLTFTLAAYYAPWRNQINAITANFVSNGIQQQLRGSANSGSVDMYGAEFEGNFDLGKLNINFGASLNDSSINTYTNPNIIWLTGITDFNGKHNPNTSRYNASLGAQYTDDLGDLGTWYVRGDWSFKSGLYATQGNEVRTPDAHFFNGRVGIDTDTFSISAFVNNIFNNKTPISVDAQGSTQAPGFPYSTYYSRLLLGLPDLRTFGLEGKYKF